MSEEQVRNVITAWKDMDNRLVAEIKSKQNVIGNVGYWIDKEGHYCIDYDFNPRYCGKGYATEANQSYKNDENGNPILISTFLYKLDKATFNLITMPNLSNKKI